MIDYVIITFKKEEFEAVLEYFITESAHPSLPANPHLVYTYRSITTPSGVDLSVAIVRTITQGLGEAQKTATNIIEDLHPRCIIATGIAGGVPCNDIFLGDVVLATHIHDFSLTAKTEHGIENSVRGYPINRNVNNAIASLTDSHGELGDWNSEKTIGYPRQIIRSATTGDRSQDKDWNERIVQTIQNHKDRNDPKFVDGTIASSDSLQKDPEQIKKFLNSDRNLLAVEMEGAGIAKACDRSDKKIPFIIIRSISDIVGLQRSDDVTLYACKVAAAFTHAIIRLNINERISQNQPSDGNDALSDLLSSGEKIKDPAPIQVIEKALELSSSEFRDNFIPESKGQIILVNTSEVQFDVKSTSVINPTITEKLIYELLNFIAEHSRKSQGIGQCRNAFRLFLELAPHRQRNTVLRLFDVLDKPMKALGDKCLILKVANKCIEVTDHPSRTPDEAECETRARICGTSWAYQRLGKLDLAAHEAELSIELSRKMNLSKSLAFCHKCNGRLARLRAEKTTDQGARESLFQKSVEDLSIAADMFSQHDGFGPEHSEIGDCHSLLARTFLSIGKVAEAEKHVEKASKLIADDNSKDYFDLLIVIGDIAARRGDMRAARTSYTNVIEHDGSHDYQMSEIVARAYRQRGKLYEKYNNKPKAVSDLTKAATIWESYNEEQPAADAKWKAILIRQEFPRPVLRVLDQETSPIVKVHAFQLIEHEQKTASKTHKSLSRRAVHDVTIWKRKLKQARDDLALNRSD